ncbi:Glycerophosphoryl diester phosphodiesterase family protein [Desulfosarcina cetonica]|nr:Glycerophosphoryl diester phosphodiesterase family protein [Desulfosarcina cetonica]
MAQPRFHPSEWIETHFHRWVDEGLRRWPRPVPPPYRLRACRIVSHRGEHDNRTCLENTLPAFDAAVKGGVWGIELDVRWTRDQVPVVFHDADTKRLYGEAMPIAGMSLDVLKRRFPAIPTLASVVKRYGGRVHLMIEVKDPAGKLARRLEVLLRCCRPGHDYHLMSLNPAVLDHFSAVPPTALLPIARLRMDRFSRQAIRADWGGVTGHLLAATQSMLDRHHRLGQRVGTGFVDSPGALFREVARGVDWLFSNRAVAMQRICDAAG